MSKISTQEVVDRIDQRLKLIEETIETHVKILAKIIDMLDARSRDPR